MRASPSVKEFRPGRLNLSGLTRVAFREDGVWICSREVIAKSARGFAFYIRVGNGAEETIDQRMVVIRRLLGEVLDRGEQCLIPDWGLSERQ